MQIFYFHLNHLRELIVDPDGSELPDLEAAKSEASQGIRDIAAECLRARREFTLWSVRICNEEGDLLAEVLSPEALNEVLTGHIFVSSNSDSHV
jgi:hypothetical protein